LLEIPLYVRSPEVYVVIPDNDRGKRVSRITVSTSPVPDEYLAGPGRDCAVIPADLSTKAARVIARWLREQERS
jgi:hypothetical protein